MEPFKRYHTDSSAESILNFVLVITLVMGMIISFVLMAIGVVAICRSDYFEATTDLSGTAFGIIFILAGIVNVVIVLIGWAMGKLWINVSRNLFNINGKVEAIYNAMPVAEVVVTEEVEA